ncbi:MAG: hypothetical protein AB2L18_07230 [Anaerolineaceae bacterium]
MTKIQHNDIVVLMIPESVNIGSSWNVLPPGLYDATLEEVRERFATNDKRIILYNGLLKAAKSLKIAGCRVIYLDGSYITDKPNPGDFDVCWDPIYVDPKKLDPVFLDFSDLRKNQKLKFGGEFFPASAKADGTNTFISFFQIDKETGIGKGIIRIQL